MWQLNSNISCNIFFSNIDEIGWYTDYLKKFHSMNFIRGLPLITYAPRGGGWGQASYTFPLRITC